MYVNETTAPHRQRHLTLVTQTPKTTQPASSSNIELLAVRIQNEARLGRKARVSIDALQALWACGLGRIAAKAVSA